MSRYIDADALDRDGWTASRTYPEDNHTMVYEVKKLTDFPTEDVVEVVRCKDCRHANECHKNVQYTRHESNSVTIGYSPIEWCSRGERRIDGRFNKQTGGN